ncbi:hypothetical protein [Desulfovibrio inopinatus]|uniref:hypothetical protein n=1 Tax=Desulfovibrio inopinatus TaxID=102109 RepID=UPI0012EC1135|nr:hypothetical protein [Desulfovibrio inopinatus]
MARFRIGSLILCVFFASNVWAQASFPERFSNYLKPYPGSTVEQVFTFPKATEATLHVSASIDDVAKFYYKALIDKGFKVVATSKEAHSAFMRFVRGETEFIFEAIRQEGITVYKLSL